MSRSRPDAQHFPNHAGSMANSCTARMVERASQVICANRRWTRVPAAANALRTRVSAIRPRAQALLLALLAWSSAEGLAIAAEAAGSTASAPSQTIADRVPGYEMADSLVAAINGTPEDRATWLREHLDERAREKASDLTAMLDQIAAASGGLEIVRQRRSGRILMTYVTTRSGRSSRVDLVIDNASNKPLAINGFPWPRQAPPIASPESDAELASAIERRVSFSAGHDDFSGVVLVTRDDETVLARAYGMADRSAARPNTMDTRFNLGSMDKMFTAVAIGQLIEQGKLTLESPLMSILADYPNAEAAKAITVRHLLDHTAGLGSLFDRPAHIAVAGKRYTKVTELLPAFAAEPLLFAPGAEARYSNEGFVVLGAIIEKISGLSYYDYVDQNVFAPAGMKNTGYPRAADIDGPAFATGYRFPAGDSIGAGERVPNGDVFGDLIGNRGNSAGGGYSTAGDIMAFLRAVKQGRLLTPPMAEAMTGLNSGGEEDYGLGFEHIAIGQRTARGHSGGGPGTGINADAKLVWENGYGYVILGNYDAPFTQIVGSDIAAALAASDHGARRR